jgi:hypothetical protein
LAKALRSGIRLVESFLTGLSCSQQNFPQSIAGRLPIWRHDRDRALDCPVLMCGHARLQHRPPKFASSVTWLGESAADRAFTSWSLFDVPSTTSRNRLPADCRYGVTTVIERAAALC